MAFAAVTSHDLAAPLTAIGGYLELLDDLYGKELEPQARTWLGTARASVDRMHNMMRSLLSYATPGGGLTVCCSLPQRAETVPAQCPAAVSADSRPKV